MLLPMPPPRTAELSAREREVLRLIATGASNAQIAAALVITTRTARFHVSSILEKLGATNRTHVVALAARRGLLDPSDASEPPEAT